MRRGMLGSVTACLISISGLAMADSPPQGAAAAPAKLSVNSGVNCAGQYYPALAVRLNHEGATVLTLHIDDGGTIAGADITQSSGWPELDDASIKCATSKWHFTPATQDGKPIASTKTFRITWKLRGYTSQPHLSGALGAMEATCSDIFADAKLRWPAYQFVVVQFRITATGDTASPFVAISTGDALFNAKVLQCVTRLRYHAAILDGIPTEVSWNAAVRWRPSTGLTYLDPYDIGPYCPDENFPADLWKGDEPKSAVISFHVVQGGVNAAAIEHSSGSPGLDQAALKCVQTWQKPFASMGAGPEEGDVVRVDWQQGHAFILETPPN